jgi:hypothetical protein
MALNLHDNYGVEFIYRVQIITENKVYLSVGGRDRVGIVSRKNFGS